MRGAEPKHSRLTLALPEERERLFVQHAAGDADIREGRSVAARIFERFTK
jgi:hypothetical protein